MTRISETPRIADFAREGHGDDEGNTTHRLVAVDDWCHRPSWDDLTQLVLDSAQADRSITNGIDAVLKDDLLGRVFEALGSKSNCVGMGPMFAARINPAVAQEK